MLGEAADQPAAHGYPSAAFNAAHYATSAALVELSPAPQHFASRQAPPPSTLPTVGAKDQWLPFRYEP